ncbi:MAG: hypothetical protein U9R42_14605 [Bacteroidota bacterium]|nr:hypothetical protein [Bacteroidota bacterium]
MSRKDKNTTKFCASEVSFEFREIHPTLTDAKNTRLMKLFAEDLVNYVHQKQQLKTSPLTRTISPLVIHKCAGKISPVLLIECCIHRNDDDLSSLLIF